VKQLPIARAYEGAGVTGLCLRIMSTFSKLILKYWKTDCRPAEMETSENQVVATILSEKGTSC
jgi:hypothetical protein